MRGWRQEGGPKKALEGAEVQTLGFPLAWVKLARGGLSGRAVGSPSGIWGTWAPLPLISPDLRAASCPHRPSSPSARTGDR